MMQKVHELYVVQITVLQEYEEPLCAFIDASWNHIGWVIEQTPRCDSSRCSVYFDLEPSFASLKDQLQRLYERLQVMGFVRCNVVIQQTTLKEEDWCLYWRKNFSSFTIGESLLIKPVWEDISAKWCNKCIIEINPGLAFGTGLHPTTRFCLEILDRYAGNYTDVLDVGCGSGILSVAAAKLGANAILGFDFDPVAVNYAQKTINLNNVADRIRVIHADLTQFEPPKQYDMVLVNIYAEVLISNAQKIIASFNTSGLLVLTGIVRSKLNDVRREFTSQGLIERFTMSEAEWSGLLFSH